MWQNPVTNTSGASRSQAVPGTEAACLSHTLVSMQSRQAMDCIPMHSYSQAQLPPSHVLPLLFTCSFQQVSLQEMSPDSAVLELISVPSWTCFQFPLCWGSLWHCSVFSKMEGTSACPFSLTIMIIESQNPRMVCVGKIVLFQLLCHGQEKILPCEGD